MRRLLSLSALLLVVGVPRGDAVYAEAATMVFVNGQAGPAHFNDGDTLKVTGGPLAGTRARLAGFNTLESYGPVHRWGEWTHKELYFNAKQATLFSRRGVWHCEGDGERDGYGRMLLECDDLAIALIREGLAHALTITAEPSKPRYLAAQRAAIKERKGMWAHGAPDWVITSAHSVSERPDEEYAYNRVVSSADGHSEMWQHDREYDVCEEICVPTVESVPKDAAERLDGEWLTTLGPEQREHIVFVWMMLRSIAKFVPEEHEAEVRSALEGLKLSNESTGIESCHVFVPFKRRFNRSKADCLK